MRRKIKDKDVLWLLDEIIDSVSMDEIGRPVTIINSPENATALNDPDNAQGVPIGNYLSQYLANLCLCYFMHWTNEELARLVQKVLRLTEKPMIKVT